MSMSAGSAAVQLQRGGCPSPQKPLGNMRSGLLFEVRRFALLAERAAVDMVGVGPASELVVLARVLLVPLVEHGVALADHFVVLAVLVAIEQSINNP